MYRLVKKNIARKPARRRRLNPSKISKVGWGHPQYGQRADYLTPIRFLLLYVLQPLLYDFYKELYVIINTLTDARDSARALYR